MFNKISIIGLGLIGSSIARAVKKHNIATNVTAYNKTASVLQKALQAGMIDSAASSVTEAAKGADIVILCTPTGTYKEISAQIAAHIGKDTILTDAGSVKGRVIKDISASLDKNALQYYVPGHPIAGSEKSGLDAGREDLYEGKKVILTPTKVTNTEAVEKISKFWEKCGSNIIIMDADEHDEAYALSSHILHFISFTFVNSIGSNHLNINDTFRHFIRLAGSSPYMWGDIFIHNKDAILSNLQKFYSAEALLKITGKQMEKAVMRRLSLGEDNMPLHSAGTNAISDILPRLIACKAVESIKNTAHTGSGFLGITENILHTPEDFRQVTKEHKTDLKNAVNTFSSENDKLAAMIKKEDLDAIHAYIDRANRVKWHIL